MPHAYISLGSNWGDRRDYVNQAVKMIRNLPVRDFAVSHYYLTEALTHDNSNKPDFLNAVCRVDTRDGPHDLLRALKMIEARLGRVRHTPWGPRTIDLDLLTFAQLVIEDATLTIPHPELTLRDFILIPFAEVAPHWVHPVKGKTAKEFLQLLADSGEGGKVIACCGCFSG